MLSTLKSLSLLLLSSNLITPILSLPADSSPAPSPLKSSLDKREIERQRREALSSFPYIGHEQRDLEQRSAGLFWGPKEVGNLKLYIVNPEEGYAGPKFPWANHINVHVDKKIPGPRGDFKPVVNLHVVKYSSGDKSNCLYAWDSVTGKVAFDSCFDDFTDAAAKCIEAIKDTVDTLIENADFIAKIVIIGALVAALLACISSLGVVALA